MSTVTTPVGTLLDGLAAKLRKTASDASFSIFQSVPKILNLRQNERAWVAFRTALGVCGAALVILPLSLWNSYLFAVAGLAMFTVAILLPPAEVAPSLDEKARELGASTVVNGGLYQSGRGSAVPVHLFVGAENLWALDSSLRPLLVLPIAELTSLRAQELDGTWVLHVVWKDRDAEFIFTGIFAERLAFAAGVAIQGVRTPIPEASQKHRAATA